MKGEEGKEEEEKEGGKEGGREDEGAACSPLIPSNIPLDDRARAEREVMREERENGEQTEERQRE